MRPEPVFALLAGCGLLASCGTSGSVAKRAAAPAGARVEISDYGFGPAEVCVRTGGTITWTNRDSAPQTATALGEVFDTGRLERGDSRRIRLDRPGTYRYYCAYHRFMEATVVVEPASNERTEVSHGN